MFLIWVISFLALAGLIILWSIYLKQWFISLDTTNHLAFFTMLITTLGIAFSVNFFRQQNRRDWANQKKVLLEDIVHTTIKLLTYLEYIYPHKISQKIYHNENLRELIKEGFNLKSQTKDKAELKELLDNYAKLSPEPLFVGETEEELIRYMQKFKTLSSKALLEFASLYKPLKWLERKISMFSQTFRKYSQDPKHYTATIAINIYKYDCSDSLPDFICREIEKDLSGNDSKLKNFICTFDYRTYCFIIWPIYGLLDSEPRELKSLYNKMEKTKSTKTNSDTEMFEEFYRIIKPIVKYYKDIGRDYKKELEEMKEEIKSKD